MYSPPLSRVQQMCPLCIARPYQISVNVILKHVLKEFTKSEGLRTFLVDFIYNFAIQAKYQRVFKGGLRILFIRPILILYDSTFLRPKTEALYNMFSPNLSHACQQMQMHLSAHFNVQHLNVEHFNAHSNASLKL